MTTLTGPTAPAPNASGVPVSETGTSPTPSRRDLRTVRMFWHREVIRLRRSKVQLAMGLVTPVMFLLVLGTGLESLGGGGDFFADYRAYLFPGVLVMATQAPAIAVGISVVWDRQAGMLRQALVAPVRRVSMLLGLSLGGATCGAVYGGLVLVIAGAAGIAYHPLLLVVLLEIALIALLFTAAGMLAAVSIKRIQTFQVVVSLSLMPLLFLSGSLFPPSGLPGWLGAAVHLNPLTYAVDAVRRTVPAHDGAATVAPSPEIAGWVPPVPVELGFIAAVTMVLLVLAARRFGRSE